MAKKQETSKYVIPNSCRTKKELVAMAKMGITKKTGKEKEYIEAKKIYEKTKKTTMSELKEKGFTERITLLLKPSIKIYLEACAESHNKSLNEYINYFLDNTEKYAYCVKSGYLYIEVGDNFENNFYGNPNAFANYGKGRIKLWFQEGAKYKYIGADNAINIEVPIIKEGKKKIIYVGLCSYQFDTAWDRYDWKNKKYSYMEEIEEDIAEFSFIPFEKGGKDD